MLPKDVSPKSTLQEYFYNWRSDGTAEMDLHELLLRARDADE